MFKKILKNVKTLYNYVEERYSLQSIVSFLLLGLTTGEIILYYVLDYFMPSSLILTFVIVAIPLSVYFLSMLLLVLAFRGLQVKQKNSIFSYFTLMGSVVPLVFLGYQNTVLAVLAIAFASLIVVLMSYPLLSKWMVWLSGVGFIFYVGIALFYYRESIMEALRQLSLVALFVLAFVLGDARLFNDEVEAYRQTLDIAPPKEIQDLEMVDNSDYMLMGTYIGYSFSYKVEPSYFGFIKDKVHNVPCEVPRKYLLCYEGKVNAYYHRIKYDMRTKRVEHHTGNRLKY